MPLEKVWELSLDMMAFTSRAFGLRVHAYVLMNNHYHLLVDAPNSNLPEAMNYYQRELSRMIARMLGRKNHVFGGPFFASLVDNDAYLQTVYRYIYRNPVEAGLAQMVEQYPYSTLQGILGVRRISLPVIDPCGLVEETEAILSWLNRDYAKIEQKECIRRGLRFARFEWRTGKSKRNCWTDDLVFRINAL